MPVFIASWLLRPQVIKAVVGLVLIILTTIYEDDEMRR
jgi:hypothetical protein